MNVVSFFAGCGGLDLGFEQAGFNVIWANELDPNVYDTYTANHPNTNFILKDICSLDSKEIPDCDGFIGGPPCQSWSVAGKQLGLQDKRGQLFLKYIELIRNKKPKFFLIENVKGILDEKFKTDFNNFLRNLEAADYNVQWKLLDSVNYKIPQNRERVFIVGFRSDLNVEFNFPTSICTKPVSLKEAIGDIVECPRYFVGQKIETINQVRTNHDVYAGTFGPYYTRGNRRRNWDSPSFTIHATCENAPLHPSSPSMIFYEHEKWGFQAKKKNEYRRLSVRECARIQTFPDNFIFKGTDIKALYKMIGNAVPPRLGYILASSIMSTLSNSKSIEILNPLEMVNTSNPCILVGYYKSEQQHNLIIKNLLYYVRSDHRKGSISKEECSIIPSFLLLHHENTIELYELETESPKIVNASFLKSLGFETSGDSYLCFRLKNTRRKSFQDFGVTSIRFKHGKETFSPYFSSVEEIIRRGI